MVTLELDGMLPLAQLADENDVVSCDLFLDLVDSLTPADKAQLRQIFVDTVLDPISAGQKVLEGYAGPNAEAQNEPVLRLVLKGVFKIEPQRTPRPHPPPIRECQSLLVVRISTLDQQQMFNAFPRGVFCCIVPERITTVEGFGGLPRPMWTNAMADNGDIPVGLRNNTSVIFSGMANPQPPDVVIFLLSDVVLRVMWEARRCAFPVWHLNSLQDVWFRTAMVDEHRVRFIQYVAADGGEVWGGAARRVGNQEVIGLTRSLSTSCTRSRHCLHLGKGDLRLLFLITRFSVAGNRT
jgi:hypothetical protein